MVNELAVVEELAAEEARVAEEARTAEQQAREKGMRRHEELTRQELRDGERMFPIYRVGITWPESYKPGAERRMHRDGQPPLPEGRFWNSTGWDSMEKEARDPEAIAAELLRDWWPKYTEKLLKPGEPVITIGLKRHDVWCDGWFSHYTIDVGMSDQEVRDSFARYVERIMYNHDMSENQRGGMLMGAEDHWRWHGCVDGNPQGERTEAPCRCAKCKEQGLVRIDH